MTSLVKINMILYVLIMHDEHDIDQTLKNRISDLPTIIFGGM